MTALAEHNLDQTDRAMLQQLQQSFPLEPQPWTWLGRYLSIPAAEARQRVWMLRTRGLIRQISAIYDTRRLGYQSTLVAARISESRIDDAAAVVSTHPGVSHNYRREAIYNLWFTLAVPPDRVLEDELDELRRRAGLETVHALPAVRTFRIGVQFDLGAGSRAGQVTGAHPATTACNDGEEERCRLSERDKRFIAVTQDDLPIVPQPFEPWCKQLNVSMDELCEWMLKMQRRRVMRRFGAVLRHRQLGFTANAMVVWQVPAAHIEVAGERAAAFDEVTHCYERPTAPDWPYNLYTMIHAQSTETCEAVANQLWQELLDLQIPRPHLIYSTKEYKKQRVRYFVSQ
ncbi:MAG: Lrp/AsnC family transcriptional regulator [bacterium]